MSEYIATKIVFAQQQKIDRKYTKLSLSKWLLALYFVAANKNGIFEMARAKYISITLMNSATVLTGNIA